jgi:hypothetical protein
MKHAVVIAGVALVASASFASAQVSPSCPGGAAVSVAQITQDACQKAVDVFQYLAPQLGGLIAGGNATLGQGGITGGPGHFSVGVRVNAVRASVPRVEDASVQPVITGARSSQFRAGDTFVPAPVADAAIGIFKGFPIGLSNIGGIDVLGSVSYIPDFTLDGVSVDTDNPLRFGFGARVSALQESIVTPGIAVTYLRRDLPTFSLTGSAIGATLRVRDLDEKTQAWRIVASKNLVMFGLAVGFGQDRYESSAVVNGTMSGVTSNDISVSQSMTRSNMFADLSFNLPLLKFTVELGQVFGGEAPPTLNTFDGRGIVDSRLYASAGLRFTW